MHDLIGKVRDAKEKGLSKEEVQGKVFEFYENEHESNSHLGERLIMLRKGGLANIFDYLEMHPSGDINNRRDPVWENI